MDETWEEAQIRPRESEPNPTQKRMGEGDDPPVDVSWDEERFGEKPGPETEGAPEAQEKEGFQSL
jgi:hypothetical protein